MTSNILVPGDRFMTQQPYESRRRSFRLTWTMIRTACRDKRKYILLYMECLKQGKVGGNDRIKEMDNNLSIGMAKLGIIVHFRKIAHIRLEKEKRLAALKKYEEEEEEEEAKPGANRGWISIMGWSIGGGRPGKPPELLGLPGEDSSEAAFFEDEVAQFQSMLEEQRRAAEASDRRPAEAEQGFHALRLACTTADAFKPLRLHRIYPSNMRFAFRSIYNSDLRKSWHSDATRIVTTS
eukprot:scaffold147349_cov17-Prasinocladus_malaysianus.AAC.1